VISGSTTAAIKALEAAIACRLSQPPAASGSRPSPTSRLPAALHHGIWLPGPGTPQFSVSGCPDIPDAERRARRVLRHCAAEQLIHSTIQAPADANDQAWKRRMMARIESNPRPAAESSSQELILAAAYPDAIAVACTSRKSPP
jgi:hypothetical protein